jgi:hypothetical protein
VEWAMQTSCYAVTVSSLSCETIFGIAGIKSVISRDGFAILETKEAHPGAAL